MTQVLDIEIIKRRKSVDGEDELGNIEVAAAVETLRELDLAANNIQFLNFEKFKFKNLQSLNISDNFVLNLCEQTFKNGNFRPNRPKGEGESQQLTESI